MANYFIHRQNLTDTPPNLVPILIISLIFCILSHSLYASDHKNDFENTRLWEEPTAPLPMSRDERHQKLGVLLNYLRKEGPGLVPGLAPALQNPVGWIHGHLGLDLNFFQEDGHEGGAGVDVAQLIRPMEDLARPVAEMMRAPVADDPKSIWLSPQYHHKGFLPTRDAMIVGATMRQRLWGEALQFDLHPYYGQGLSGSPGYWGTEVTINMGTFRDPSSTDRGRKSIGSISLRYTNGQRDLMDNTHGFDLHSEFNFTDQLGLNAGVRQDQNNQRDDYVLLHMKWQLD